MRSFCTDSRCQRRPAGELGGPLAADERDGLVVSAPALPVPDAEERHWLIADYAWSLRLRLCDDTEGGWRSFQQGYLAGGEIGRRRYDECRTAAEAR